MSELRYRSNVLTDDQLALEIREFWSVLRSDPQVQGSVREQGIDVDGLLSSGGDVPITLRRDSAGFDKETTELLVIFAPVVATIARDMWKRVLLPRISRRWGEDTLKPLGGDEDGQEGPQA